MVDFFIVGCIIIILSGALFYLHKERKKGARCVGCPHAGKCNTHEGERVKTIR